MKRCGQILSMAQPFLWTRDHFDQLVDTGMFLEGPRVELIEGEILLMSPHTKGHILGIAYPNTVLTRLFGETHVVRVQLPLELDEYSQPQPDFALSPLGDFDRADLVIEVSHTSLNHDRKRKGPLYARCGIPEYWIANLNSGLMEVYRRPVKGKYTDQQSFAATDSVCPLFAPEVAVPLASFFLQS